MAGKKDLNIITINLLILLVFIIFTDLATAFIKRNSGSERVSGRQVNAYFHHGLIPNSTFKHNWVKGKEIIEKINKFGFRSNNSDLEVSSLKEYKTVLIGDSFAEGVGVLNSKIIPSLLPTKLWPIANLGVISHTPYLSKSRLSYYRSRGLNPKNIIHLVDPSDFQDELHYYKIEGFRPPYNFLSKALANIVGDSFLSSTFTWEALLTVSWLMNSENLIRSIDLYKYWGGRNNYYKDRYPFKESKEPSYFQESKERLISQLKLSVEANRDSNYIIVIYEWPPLFESYSSKRYQRFELYKNELEKLTDQFENSFLCDASKANLKKEDFIKDDVHWNENGHRKISNFIANKCI